MIDLPEQNVSLRFGWLLAAASLIFAATVATTATVRQSQGTKPVNPPERPAGAAQDVPTREEEDELARIGEETTERVCATACHPIEKVYTLRRTARDWTGVMADMAARGAPATDAQFATVKRYLTRYFGIVSVNTAPAEELSAVLGFSPKDAKAIVEHRNAHGKFGDVAALLKVAGIDKAKIEAQPEALILK